MTKKVRMAEYYKVSESIEKKQETAEVRNTRPKLEQKAAQVKI